MGHAAAGRGAITVPADPERRKDGCRYAPARWTSVPTSGREHTVIRNLARVLIAVSVVVFTVSFLVLSTTEYPANGWGFAIFGSILGFMGGLFTLAFSIPGIARAQGPKSFAALDVSGALASPVNHEVARPAKTWTRTWMNVYFWTGLGELYLAALFIVSGILSDDSDALAGGLATAGILGVIGLVFMYAAYRTYNKNKLHTTGLDGRATIMSVTQTGIWANNNPVTVLDCKIHVDGHPDYEVRHRETVPQVTLGRLTSGATLPVKVNPKNPSDFVIQWEQA
jgi:hypothetical protein